MNDFESNRTASGLTEFSGVLDKKNVNHIWQQRQGLLENDTPHVIDLAKITRCDSAGLALLVCLKKEAEQSGLGLTFTNIPQHLQQLIGLSHLDDILNRQQSL